MWKKFKDYVIDVKYELKKVSYPDKKNLWGSTFVVIIVSLLIGLLIGLFDFIISKCWFTTSNSPDQF